MNSIEYFNLKFSFIYIYLFYLQVGFAITDAATGLKLVEAGVPKETLAMLAVPMIPLQIVLPWVISRYTSGKARLEPKYFFAQAFLSVPLTASKISYLIIGYLKLSEDKLSHTIFSLIYRSQTT